MSTTHSLKTSQGYFRKSWESCQLNILEDIIKQMQGMGGLQISEISEMGFQIKSMLHPSVREGKVGTLLFYKQLTNLSLQVGRELLCSDLWQWRKHCCDIGQQQKRILGIKAGRAEGHGILLIIWWTEMFRDYSSPWHDSLKSLIQPNATCWFKK